MTDGDGARAIVEWATDRISQEIEARLKESLEYAHMGHYGQALRAQAEANGMIRARALIKEGIRKSIEGL